MGTCAEDDSEFNDLQFEKRLTALKDSQESINAFCQWCLGNRQHYKKIVNSWLNVFKRVKIEQRLTLFYLANDVIQYSKKRRYEYVEGWATAIQKATTMVRDDKIKHKILRIFKIWEDRGVYNEEFISDLCGLLSVTPAAPKNDEPHEFQPTYVISKIRVCTSLESDTDLKLQALKEQDLRILDSRKVWKNVKDRAKLDDCEKEVESCAKYIEDYINALKAEIKSRISLISILKQAENQLDTDRKDVKVVANAYRSFGTRVKTFQKKLDELATTLTSPIPSPDVNAPSPNSDSDIDLPEESPASPSPIPTDNASSINDSMADISHLIQFTNANYYTPVPAPTTDTTPSYVANGFTSFVGVNLDFTSQSFSKPSTDYLSTNSDFGSSTRTTTTDYSSLASLLPSLTQPPPPPVKPNNTNNSYSYVPDHSPLLPPPMPPFGSKEEEKYNQDQYNNRFGNNAGSYSSPTYDLNATSYQTTESDFSQYSTSRAENYEAISSLFASDASYEPPLGANPYPPTDEYNPEQELETWEADASWAQPPLELDTPESPPPFEKEAYGDPVEYDHTMNDVSNDVDTATLSNLNEPDVAIGRGQDVDHRNLIKLIGSPTPDSNSNPTSSITEAWTNSDQDYRTAVNSTSADHDYRLPPFDIEQLKLPPPPPPPNSLPIPVVSSANQYKKQAVNAIPQDNVESIDMDLSDDEYDRKDSYNSSSRDNLKVVVDSSKNVILNSFDSLLSQQKEQMTEILDNESDELDDELSEKIRILHNQTEDNNQMNQQIAMEPPPPLPELPDDMDENMFLEDLTNDISEFLNECDAKEENSNNVSLQSVMQAMPQMAFPSLGQPPFLPMPPPMMPFEAMVRPPFPPNNHMPNNFAFRGRGANPGRGIFQNNHRGNFRRGRGQNYFNNNNANKPNNFRGARGGGHNQRFPRGNGPRGRGNFRGNFRGGFA